MGHTLCDYRQMGLSATLIRNTMGLRDRAESLGHAGIIGLALIAASVAFVFGGLEPLRDEVREMQSRQQRLIRAAQRPVIMTAEEKQAMHKELHLPTAAEALPQVMRLSDLAEKQGLKLRQGDYRLHRDRDAGVSAYQMHYPVNGSYAALREFINKSLEEFPALALEEVLIRRNTIGATDVEARLRFTLYLVEK